MAMRNGKNIIEMLGIAGAGKTTLRQILQQRNAKIRFRISPPKISYFPFLFKCVCTWLPIYIFKYPKDRWFTWKEMKIMGYLETWDSYLRREALQREIVSVLDPGSVYWLTVIREFGPQFTRSPQFKAWWIEKLYRWREALGLIIWLDASNELLLDRVNTRREWHEAKAQTREAACEEFSRLRKGYAEIVQLMKNEFGPQLLQFDSDQLSPDQIADRVLEEANLYAD